MNTRAYVVDRFETQRHRVFEVPHRCSRYSGARSARSPVENPLKSRLLRIVDGAETDLALGQNVHARKALLGAAGPAASAQQRQAGLSATQAGEWIAEAQKLVSKIPLDWTVRRAALSILSRHPGARPLDFA